MHTLSSNHFSTDTQALDVLAWMRIQHPRSYCAVLREFPEAGSDLKMDGSWFATEAMGVDPEWGSWLVDALESSGLVAWQEGEPWALVPDTGDDAAEIAAARSISHCEECAR